jgi:mannosyl-3-phosphoglycerate synthase
MKRNVEVYQIESRNPHLHEAGDKEHIDQMISMASQVIYHSPVCPDEIRKTIVTNMIKRKMLVSKQLPSKPHYFPALSNIDRNTFLRHLKSAPYACLIKDGKL